MRDMAMVTNYGSITCADERRALPITGAVFAAPERVAQLGTDVTAHNGGETWFEKRPKNTYKASCCQETREDVTIRGIPEAAVEDDERGNADRPVRLVFGDGVQKRCLHHLRIESRTVAL